MFFISQFRNVSWTHKDKNLIVLLNLTSETFQHLTYLFISFFNQIVFFLNPRLNFGTSSSQISWPLIIIDH